MTENGSDLVLDGNAAAGLLQEIFVLEITTAQIQCSACGSTAAVGSLRLYAAPMGAVLSCTRCDGILMRAVHTPHGRWLEMTGARYLRFLSSVEMTLRADAERRLGGAGRGQAAHHRVRRQRRDLGREGLRWRGWFGIDSTAMERAELLERERLSLAEQFGVPIEEVPHDYGAYLHFIKEKGAEIYYKTTMALLYQIDPERIDDVPEPLELQPLLQVLTADADYLVY